MTDWPRARADKMDQELWPLMRDARMDAQSRSTIDGVVAGLVRCSHHANGSSFINLPMFYPDGSSVTVRVTPRGDGFKVDDFGFAWEMDYGDADRFKAAGKLVADRDLVDFDGETFSLCVDADALHGAICCVAMASLTVAQAMSDAEEAYLASHQPAPDDTQPS